MVDEALHIKLHLQCAVPFLECEHRSPVKPEIRTKEVLTEHLIDPFVVELFGEREDEIDDLFSRLRSQLEVHAGPGIASSIDGGPAVTNGWGHLC